MLKTIQNFQKKKKKYGTRSSSNCWNYTKYYISFCCTCTKSSMTSAIFRMGTSNINTKRFWAPGVLHKLDIGRVHGYGLDAARRSARSWSGFSASAVTRNTPVPRAIAELTAPSYQLSVVKCHGYFLRAPGRVHIAKYYINTRYGPSSILY